MFVLKLPSSPVFKLSLAPQHPILASMDEMPMIRQGCKLARVLEASLTDPNMAAQRALLLDSCVEIVNTFSKAISQLDPEHPFASFQVQAWKKPSELLIGSSSRQQPVMDRLPLQSLVPVEIDETASSRRSRKRKDSKEKVSYRVPAQGNSEVPPDKFVWRKYGQKEILGSKFPRSYYRCTHSKLGCEAKKQVQRSDDDYYTFQVTYTGSHTCQATFQSFPQYSDVSEEPSPTAALSQIVSSTIQTSIMDPFQLPSLPFQGNSESSETAVVKDMDNPGMDLEDVMFYFPNTSNSMDAIFTSKS